MDPMQYVLDDQFFEEDGEITEKHRNLPHWSQEGKLYFLTWRLADSLPQEMLEQLAADRDAWARRHGDKPLSEMELPLKHEWYRLFHHRVQNWLDAGHGSCALRRPEAQRIMAGALHHFSGQRYILGSFAVAGNHVHVLAAPLPGFTLSGVLHSWKSFTANAINKALGRTGRLWMDEYFDKLVRDQGHLERIEDYIAAHAKQGALVERRTVVE
jgi:REP element-mobilizing transposase RayT